MGLKSGGVRGSLRNVSVSIPNSVVDHFEESLYEDQNNTLTDYYGGDTGQFTRQQTTVQEGSYALEVTTPDMSFYGIADADAPNNPPVQGDTFRCWVRHSGLDSGDVSDYIRILFATQSGTVLPQGNLVRVSGDDTLVLEVRDSQGVTNLASESVSVSADTWYEIEVEWLADGSITCSLYDSGGTQIGSGISATDTTHTSGGVGFAINSNSNSGRTAYWDNYRVI